MRARPGRHALLLGLTVSAILHALLLLLNPGMQQPPRRDLHRSRAVPPPSDRLAAVLLELTEEEAARRAAAAPVVTTRPATPAQRDSARLAGPAAPAAPNDPPTLLERLRVGRDPTLWAVPAPPVESAEERALRQLAARLEEARSEKDFPLADPSLPPAGGGIRIPFGKKPPPPAQTVPAPPRLATLAVDSARPLGGLLHVYYGDFALSRPLRLRAGVAFRLTTRLATPQQTAAVYVFVDGVRQASFTDVRGEVHAELTIAAAGSHRIMVHVISAAGYAPSQLVHQVEVEG